jgi:hypothetical protein
MVNRLGLLGLALCGAFLTGCPDDLGQNLNGNAGRLRAPASLQGVTSMPGLQILLTWEPQASGENGYRLEVSPGPFGSSGSTGLTYLLLPVGTTTYSYTSQPNHTYYFRIFAVTDTMESDPSDELVVVTPYALATPGNISAQGLSATSFSLRWSLVAGATGYQIEYSEDLGSSWWLYPLQVAAGVDNAVLTVVERGKTTYFRVVALGPLGNSAPSEFIQVSTQP